MDEKEVRKIIREELAGLIGVESFIFQKNIQILDARDIQLGRTNGTKLGTATDQKIALYGTTPIIQQTTSSQTPATFSAGSSGISNDSATWGGYTVGDLVAILQAFGLIA